MEQGAMEGAVTTEREHHTRVALAEITARLTNTRDMSTTLPSGYLSRKICPTTCSPDMEFKRNSSFHSLVRTPPKTSGRVSPPKLGATLRSTLRKRLLLD
ncbi:unnamed protein product [Diatraea saccharalis]|uniref:Uncharacterized protein n=1 Tax=Diatraea saccharalis TaxID=40085 RepID=A0A9N9R1P3_9NEOP|nr:unnamed protein product [Diatraea saccharalis]